MADGSGLLVVAILWALMLEIGTSVTTADVNPEVLVNDLLHRQAEEVELPIIMVEDVYAASSLSPSWQALSLILVAPAKREQTGFGWSRHWGGVGGKQWTILTGVHSLN